MTCGSGPGACGGGQCSGGLLRKEFGIDAAVVGDRHRAGQVAFLQISLRNVRRGDVAYITKGMLHSIRAVTDLHFIEVQIGDELSEDDIQRFISRPGGAYN